MKENTIFKEILNLINDCIISNAVKKYSSDKYSKNFKTRDHLAALIFVQIVNCRSLRDLEIKFNTGLKYSKASGIKMINRSTLSYANNKRSSLVLAEIAKQLVCKQIVKTQSILEILDSSIITINGRGSDWTMSTKTRCGKGLKLHVQCSENENFIDNVLITNTNINDITAAKTFELESGKIYVFDKGYNDCNHSA